MNWSIELSASAIKQLKKLPLTQKTRIVKAIDQMEVDPMAGDVIPLKGPEFHDRYRRRVGNYRVIFTLDIQSKAVAISAILIRSEKTYR